MDIFTPFFVTFSNQNPVIIMSPSSSSIFTFTKRLFFNDLFLTAVISGGVVVGIGKSVVSPVQCQGPSMDPTLKTGNILLVEHLSPRLPGRIQKGDIVIAVPPNSDKRRLVCKRVAGLPGDKVAWFWWDKVPPGHVWLLGDNFFDSNDSRFYGPVPESQILSRCVLRVWPDLNSTIFHEKRKHEEDKIVMAVKNKEEEEERLV